MAHKKFSGRSTTDQVLENQELTGKNVVITGANTGIGYEAARSLASKGAKVILACRNQAKTEQAIVNIKQQHPTADVEFQQLDLASFQNIHQFAKNLTLPHIDIFIGNAGLAPMTYSETEDGLESTVGVCHFGHFLLTNLLMDKILAAPKTGIGPRVVIVSSESHRMPLKIDFNNLPYNKNNFSFVKAYGQAKLSNLLFAKELQRRYESQGLTACAIHPGNLVTTEIGRDNKWTRIGMKLISPFTKSANQGAATTVYAAAYAPKSEVAGQYLSHCKVMKSSKESHQKDVAKKLWEISEDICKLNQTEQAA